MIKINKYLLMLMCFLFLTLIEIPNVSAKNKVTFERTSYKYERNSPDNKHISDDFINYYIDGNAAFCIDPDVKVVENHEYKIGNIDDIKVSNEQKNRILLIGHYGFNYPNHQTQKFRAATQAMIWEEIMGKDSFVTFNTEYWSKGKEIDVSSERNEIENLIAHHTDKPSFNNKTYNIQVGETIEINDDNNILNNYEVYSSKDANVSIKNNKLIVTTNKVGNINIQLIKKQHYTKNYLIFVDPIRQNLMTAGAIDPVVAQVYINGIGGKVELEKYDSGKVDILSNEVSLKNAEYGIYDLNDNLLQKLITDDVGHAISDYLPYLGQFYIKEIKASKGYEVNPNKFYFEINEDNLIAKVRAKEDVITRDFDIIKVYANSNTGVMTPEKEVVFAVYNNKNEEIKRLTTDSQGNIKFRLPYGNYILKQLTASYGHEKAEDIALEVKEAGATIKKVIANAEITARLKILKIDKNSQKVIPIEGIKFKIKDLNSNEYIKQTVTYPTAQVIDIFKTDKNGVIITPYPLSSGKYALEEVENQEINGYLWNSEPLIFEINENSNFIQDEQFGTLLEVRFVNSPVKGEIIINKYGEELIIENGSFRYEEVPLDGVNYDLYADGNIYSNDGTLVYKDKELITSFYTKNGFYKLSDMFLGKYCLIERASVGNHVVDSSKHCFELKYKDQYTDIVTHNLTLKNYLKKSDFEFTKTDVEGNGLPNATITIYTNNDNEKPTLIFKGKTDEFGHIVVKGLFVSKFLLYESEAPENYILNEKPIEFEVKNDGETIKTTMINEKLNIEVPNTFLSDSKLVDIIGIVLIIAGISYVIYVKKKNK